MYKEEDEEEEAESMAELTRKYGHKFKQSKSKIKNIERQIKNIKKKEKRMEKLVTESNVYPIDLLYNSANFVDLIMNRLLKEKNLKFNLKVEFSCLLGRIIGRSKLIHPPYYHFVLRFVRPELKNPARILAFIAESVHETSCPSDLEPLCK